MAKLENHSALLSFEDKLWRSTDTLCGQVDAAEHKHVVLGLLFLKYISDSFEVRREELKKELETEGIKGKRLEHLLENRDEYTAARLIENEEERALSLQTYLELLQSVTNQDQHRCAKMFLKDFEFQILPLTENIGHRAAIYIKEYALSHGLCAGDAIVAATAVEHDLVSCASNAKHFRAFAISN